MRSHTTTGACLEAKKEYDKAIADYTEAIRLDPKNARAYTNRGGLGRQEEYDKAIADFTEAIRLDPKMPTPTTTGAEPGMTRRRSTTRPSPTTARPSGSIPSFALAYNNRGGPDD